MTPSKLISIAKGHITSRFDKIRNITYPTDAMAPINHAPSVGWRSNFKTTEWTPLIFVAIGLHPGPYLPYLYTLW